MKDDMNRFLSRKEGDNKLIDLELSLVNAEHALKSAEERHREEVFVCLFVFVCLCTLSVEETYVCFSQVSQLEGRVKQLEQELLDTRDGAGDKLDLPVGKMQVCLSNFQAYPCCEDGKKQVSNDLINDPI